MAALTYNDKKLAITQCPLFAFCKAENKDRCLKIARMNHMHHHNLAMATVHHKNFFVVAKSTQRRALARRQPDVDKAKLAAKKGSSASQHALSSDTTPKLFMAVEDNTIDNALLVTKKSMEYSDTEPCGGDSASRDLGVLSRRNRAALSKCGAQLKTSIA